MLPPSGRSKPAIIRSSVVLPHPDGPSSVKNSPALIERLTPSTAVNAPKRRVTFRISRSAIGGEPCGSGEKPADSSATCRLARAQLPEQEPRDDHEQQRHHGEECGAQALAGGEALDRVVGHGRGRGQPL